MKLLVIDGQGGGLGRSLIESLLQAPELATAEIIAVGTNSIATSAMLKAGATAAATGENAIIYNSAYADIILGAIGIAFANSMHGEISPAMATAVSGSNALKVLIPIAKCNAQVAGLLDKPMATYISDAVALVVSHYESKQH